MLNCLAKKKKKKENIKIDMLWKSGYVTKCDEETSLLTRPIDKSVQMLLDLKLLWVTFLLLFSFEIKLLIQNKSRTSKRMNQIIL